MLCITFTGAQVRPKYRTLKDASEGPRVLTNRFRKIDLSRFPAQARQHAPHLCAISRSRLPFSPSILSYQVSVAI